MISILLTLLSVARADTSSASFNWATENIPGTQLDYGEGSQILTADDTSSCQGAHAVVAAAKLTEFVLTRQANDLRHVSFGDPLYCKSHFSWDGHVDTDGCTTPKSFMQVLSYFENDGILARVYDETHYNNAVFTTTERCLSEEADYSHADYERTPTPRYQVLNLRQSTVQNFKTILLASPAIAYVHNDIKDAAIAGASAFAASDYTYNPQTDQNDVTAVLITGWGVSGESLFWRALTPWGSTTGSYGVISLVQGDTMNTGFFRYIGVAAAGSDDNQDNQAANEAETTSSGSSSGLSDVAIVLIVIASITFVFVVGVRFYDQKMQTAVSESKVSSGHNSLVSRGTMMIQSDDLALTRMGSTNSDVNKAQKV